MESSAKTHLAELRILELWEVGNFERYLKQLPGFLPIFFNEPSKNGQFF